MKLIFDLLEVLFFVPFQIWRRIHLRLTWGPVWRVDWVLFSLESPGRHNHSLCHAFSTVLAASLISHHTCVGWFLDSELCPILAFQYTTELWCIYRFWHLEENAVSLFIFKIALVNIILATLYFHRQCYKRIQEFSLGMHWLRGSAWEQLIPVDM